MSLDGLKHRKYCVLFSGVWVQESVDRVVGRHVRPIPMKSIYFNGDDDKKEKRFAYHMHEPHKNMTDLTVQCDHLHEVEWKLFIVVLDISSWHVN